MARRRGIFNRKSEDESTESAVEPVEEEPESQEPVEEAPVEPSEERDHTEGDIVIGLPVANGDTAERIRLAAQSAAQQAEERALDEILALEHDLERVKQEAAEQLESVEGRVGEAERRVSEAERRAEDAERRADQAEDRIDEDLFNRLLVIQFDGACIITIVIDRSHRISPKGLDSRRRRGIFKWRASNHDRFTQFGVLSLDLETLSDKLAQRLPASLFSVREENLRARSSQRLEPAQQIGLSRMPAQPAECMHRGPNRDLLAKNGHCFLAINQHATERARALVAHKEDCGLRPRKTVSEVMQDSAACAHTGARHDHERACHFVQCT